MAKLNALVVKGLDKPGRHPDGNGLHLYVAPKGSKSWVQRIVINGRRRDIGLGSYPTISLARAREKAHANRVAVAEGRDPLEDKREARKAARSPSPSVPTFADAAARFIEIRRPGWSNPKHAAQWHSTLATYAFPIIGNIPVTEVTSDHALEILTPIWTEKHETATRVRQRLEAVFNLVIFQRWRLDNPAGKSVLHILPSISRLDNHHKAIPYSEVPDALIKVRASTANSVTRLCFEFLVLTAARSGEVRLATWPEINVGSATWTVPAERMKARRQHRVPLSGRCLEILSQAKELISPDSGLIFPSRSGKPLSDMTLSTSLRRLEIPAVPHGFRSSFKGWCKEASQFVDWRSLSETALAHSLGESTEQAYDRTDLLEPRRPLMEAWAEFCQTECELPRSPLEGEYPAR